MGNSRNIAFLPQIYDFILKPPRIFEDYLYYGNYNFLAVSRCILSLPLKLRLSHHKAMSYDPQNDELFSLTQYGRNVNGISHNSAR